MSVRFSLPGLAMAFMSALAGAATAQGTAPQASPPQGGAPAAQNPVPHVAYPERDALTPFRAPSEVYAPPDRLFSILRRMRAMSARNIYSKSFDDRGREVLDDPTWRRLLSEAEGAGIDAGYLASVMRTSKNADDRRTAFYAMFYCDRVDYIFELISHIPGEPIQVTRQEAFPRAAEFIKANLGRKFGDLSVDQQKAIIASMPEPGSPAAKTAGIMRAPRDSDHLHQLVIRPFIQLLNEEPIDQAQSLWFLKQVFELREDLAVTWLEPALPRLMQLVVSDNADVRRECVEVLRAIGGNELREPPALDGDTDALLQWAEDAGKRMFPPIRNLNDTLIVLFPSPERDAIVDAAVTALENSSIGDHFSKQQDDGQWLRGFRVARVPESLAPLAIPEGAVITRINGAPILNAKMLLATTTALVKAGLPRKLLVEYVTDGKTRAVEYQVR